MRHSPKHSLPVAALPAAILDAMAADIAAAVAAEFPDRTAMDPAARRAGRDERMRLRRKARRATRAARWDWMAD